MVLPCIILGTEPDDTPPAARTYSISYGVNYTSTKTGQGKMGRYFSVYRERKFGRTSGLKYGYSYSSKQNILHNQKVRSSFEDYNYGDEYKLYTGDIVNKNHVLDMAALLNYRIASNRYFCVRIMFGVGLAANLTQKSTLSVDSTEIIETDQPDLTYDYVLGSGRSVNRGGSILNMGIVTITGLQFERGIYLINLIYTYDFLNMLDPYLSLQYGRPAERLHMFALVVGVRI